MTHLEKIFAKYSHDNGSGLMILCETDAPKAMKELAIKFSYWTLNNRYEWQEEKQKFVAAWENHSEYTHEELFEVFNNQ